MAIQDSTVLPAAAGAAGAPGMPPQIAAFLQMLMGGGGGGGLQGLLSHLFGGGGAEPGGLPFGGAGQGFGHFLMNNPALMQGLGLAPQGAVPGPLPGAAPVQDSTPVGPASPAAPVAPPSQDPAAPATPVGNTPAAAPAPQGMAGLASLMATARPGGLGDGAFQSILPMLRKG